MGATLMTRATLLNPPDIGTYAARNDPANVVDMRSYGLDGSGTTSSVVGQANAAALAQALADAQPGATLLFPVPTAFYYCDLTALAAITPNNPITITKAVKLAGPAHSQVKLKFGPEDISSAGFFMLTKNPGFDLEIENLIFEGLKTNTNGKNWVGLFVNADTTTTVPTGIGVGRAGRTILRNCQFLNWETALKLDAVNSTGYATNAELEVYGSLIHTHGKCGASTTLSVQANVGDTTLTTVGVVHAGSWIAVGGVAYYITSVSGAGPYVCTIANGGTVSVQAAAGAAVSQNNRGGSCILALGGSVKVRDTTFDMDPGAANNNDTLDHNIYAYYGTAVDVEACKFLNTGGYACQQAGQVVVPPKVFRFVRNRFESPNAISSGLLVGQGERALLGTGAPTALIQGNQFNLAGIAIVLNGDAVISGNSFSVNAQAIKAFAAISLGIARIIDNAFRGPVRMGDCRMTWYVRRNRFAWAGLATGNIAPIHQDASANSTLYAEDNVIEGAGGTTRQIYILGGKKARLRRNECKNADNEVQTLVITGAPTGGTFTLTFGGNTTTAIAYNASADLVETALTNLASIGAGNIMVVAANADPVLNLGLLPGVTLEIGFIGTLAGAAQALITADASLLTGGTSPAVTITELKAGSSTVNAIVVQGTPSDLAGQDNTFDNPANAFNIASGTPTGAIRADYDRNQIGAAIASAATITVPAGVGTVHVTGVTTVNTINILSASVMPLLTGTKINLIFDSTAALGTTGNIANAFAPTAGQMKLLIWDGTKWQG